MKYLLSLSTQTVTSVVGAVEMEAHANRPGPKPAETQQHRWLPFYPAGTETYGNRDH